MDRKTMGILGTIFWAGLGSSAGASGTSPSQMEQSAPSQNQQELSYYSQGVQFSQSGDFKTALGLFQKALDQDPDNPDILNQLAHCQRKTGDLDNAITNYKKAIQLRPHFPEAREYLGEAYVDAALEQLNILKTYGDDAKEELEDLTDAFKDAFKKIGS